jgi:hypothetical protein
MHKGWKKSKQKLNEYIYHQQSINLKLLEQNQYMVTPW